MSLLVALKREYVEYGHDRFRSTDMELLINHTIFRLQTEKIDVITIFGDYMDIDWTPIFNQLAVTCPPYVTIYRVKMTPWVDYLAKIVSNKLLQNLTMRCVFDAPFISKVFTLASTIDHIDMSGCDLSKEPSLAFTALLADTLLLNECNIADFIPHPKTRMIELDDNPLSDNSIRQLLSSNIKNLQLPVHAIQVQGPLVVNIESLYICAENYRNFNGSDLTDAICQSTTIRAVELFHVFSDDYEEEFVSKIMENKNIVDLGLDMNLFFDTVCNNMSLFNQLLSNESYGDNSSRCKKIRPLVEWIENNRSRMRRLNEMWLARVKYISNMHRFSGFGNILSHPGILQLIAYHLNLQNPYTYKIA